MVSETRALGGESGAQGPGPGMATNRCMTLSKPFPLTGPQFPHLLVKDLELNH